MRLTYQGRRRPLRPVDKSGLSGGASATATSVAPDHTPPVPSAPLETVLEVLSQPASEVEPIERTEGALTTQAVRTPVELAVVILSDEDSDTGPRAGVHLDGPSVGASRPSAVTRAMLDELDDLMHLYA